MWDNKEFQKFANENKDNIFREVNSIPDDLKEKSIENKDQIVSLNHKGKIMYALNGTRYSPLSSSYKNINGESVPAQLLGDLWTDIDYQNTQNQGGVSFTNAKKPEQLLKRIINLCTNEGDIVLDCFMGSATTQAVALKLNRQFIGVEQMDYINTISVPRLQKVIEGEQGGISKNKDVKWQGGGSFIYAELMEKSQGYLKDIKEATDVDELMTVYNRMKANSDINFRVDLDKFEKEFQSGELTTLDDLKKELILIIDKNQLYYNYSNIDDETVRSLISDSDYKFNKSFYATRGE
ncbi:DNA methyltransferase [Lactobacillus jensenii]|uniref:DNA methyltransferase n=1 Tax=Lactobacillus jensenii TaxID=109790 RepID=UPI002A0B7BBB|nr:site-specific DNA-methyltransferase [Lactobacillus jensenii]MCZ3725921.1 site-specific DNA-methyltransferase [Lactobacillus jensenii]MCZ3727427.1 site-specific DNA-methyltransferase [Lactobacillus jensenii]MCZ3728959.1 site-specific DNA-methyltransferase [Lactobacillus jensenii]MCZ3730479.1 site-specific DNA-methyltransferase [Lactobacillus jensenii]